METHSSQFMPKWGPITANLSSKRPPRQWSTTAKTLNCINPLCQVLYLSSPVRKEWCFKYWRHYECKVWPTLRWGLTHPESISMVVMYGRPKRNVKDVLFACVTWEASWLAYLMKKLCIPISLEQPDMFRMNPDLNTSAACTNHQFFNQQPAAPKHKFSYLDRDSFKITKVPLRCCK